MKRWIRWAAIALVLLIATDAMARMGGGHSYSGGSRSSGGSGGGGDGLGILIYYMIRLGIEYPPLGIAMLLCVVGYVVYQQRSNNKPQRAHEVQFSRQARPSRPARSRGSASVATLAAEDDRFSRWVFQDFVSTLHARYWQARSRSDLDALAPWMSENVREAATREADGVSEVVIARTAITRVRKGANAWELEVELHGGRLLGGKRQMFTEHWRLVRPHGVSSPSPEMVERMGCPSCGAAVDCDSMGRCKNCDTPIAAGQLSWQVVSARVSDIRPMPPADLGISQGDEPSWSAPTLASRHLGSDMRSFGVRNPEFDAKAWETRVHTIFVELQDAWSSNKWERARPFVTDALYQRNRFWIDRYLAHGMQNHVEDVHIAKMQVTGVSVDPWYEAISVRFWVRAADYTTKNGKRISGSPYPRGFSEVWTFLRTVGDHAASGDPLQCPSCGAPLDKVGQTGVCGYCDTRITTGRFDWVLSQVEQADAASRPE